MEIDKSETPPKEEDGIQPAAPTKSKFKRSYDVQFDLGSHLHHSILPLLQQQPTTNLSKHDVINLANTLIKLKKYILDFDLSFSIEFKDFFYSLVALSSNCIITNISASKLVGARQLKPTRSNRLSRFFHSHQKSSSTNSRSMLHPAEVLVSVDVKRQ